MREVGTYHVRERKDLSEAMRENAKEIIITGNLAFRLHIAEQVTRLSKRKIVMLSAISTVSISVVPFTGGLSSAVLLPVAATTGVSIAALVAAIFIGVGLVIAIFRDYEVVEYSDNRLILKKRG